MPIFYNLRRTADGYMMAKFDEDFNVAGVYTLCPSGSALACDCPAGPRPSCKHRKMVPIFVTAGRVDTFAFYCYETATWHQPIPAGPWDEDSASAAKAAEIVLSSPTPEQEAYLKQVETASTNTDTTAVIGGPQPKPLRRI